MIIINDKVIGVKIQAARQQKSLSQADLAAMLDVSVSYVSRIERGRIRLNIERLLELCILLNVSILDVLDGSYVATDIATRAHVQCPSKERMLQLVNTATPKALELMLELCESVYKLLT